MIDTRLHLKILEYQGTNKWEEKVVLLEEWEMKEIIAGR